MVVILLMSLRGRGNQVYTECVTGEEGGREVGEETLSTERGILTSRLKGYGCVCCNFKAKIKQS